MRVRLEIATRRMRHIIAFTHYAGLAAPSSRVAAPRRLRTRRPFHHGRGWPRPWIRPSIARSAELATPVRCWPDPHTAGVRRRARLLTSHAHRILCGRGLTSASCRGGSQGDARWSGPGWRAGAAWPPPAMAVVLRRAIAVACAARPNSGYRSGAHSSCASNSRCPARSASVGIATLAVAGRAGPWSLHRQALGQALGQVLARQLAPPRPSALRSAVAWQEPVE
jgi:hypothetical protein